MITKPSLVAAYTMAWHCGPTEIRLMWARQRAEPLYHPLINRSVPDAQLL